MLAVLIKLAYLFRIVICYINVLTLLVKCLIFTLTNLCLKDNSLARFSLMILKLDRKKFLLLLCFPLMACFLAVVSAQEFDEKQVKAAYIVNFLKHITWPNEANKDNYILAVYKEPSYAAFLSRVLKNKKIKNKAIVIRDVDKIDDLKNADSVYIPQRFSEQIHKIANALRGTNTLLISDNSLNKHDVMINLIQQEQSAVISFEVNKSNIIYEKLRMSADLLLLGGTELDIATLYRETEVAMQKSRLQSIGLQESLLKQQQQLANTKRSLKNLNREFEQAAQKQKAELSQIKADVTIKQQQLEQQRLTLETVTQQSKQTEQELLKQQLILAEESVKNERILATVEENKKVLQQQESELAQHRAQLKSQGDELTTKQQIISNQQTYLLVTTGLTTIAILATMLIIFFFNKNKKTTKRLTLTLANLNKTQEQLVQSEKMASLGRLVAGVAHEINTPLSIAITANSLVLDDTHEVKKKISAATLSKAHMDKYLAKSEQSLVMSENALERVKQLLVNFKLVSADQIVSDERELDIAKYINEVMTTLSVEMKKHKISYQFEGPDSVSIITIPGVFAQVLSNLVMNSIIHGFDQMDSGNITIVLTQAADNSIEINYYDDGKGMDEHTLENIFEPFFTTKRGEGSTGLGMNIVYNLVNQQLKGSIKVNTEQGVGTFITLAMPDTV